MDNVIKGRMVIGIIFLFLFGLLFIVSTKALAFFVILLYEARDSDFKMKFITYPILILLIGASLFLVLFSMYKVFEILGVTQWTLS